MQHDPASTSSAQAKRNRRFTYLSRLASDPSTVSATDPAFYFSDTAMRMRDPQLFDFYVGRHVPESERTQPFATSVSLVDRIFHSVDERAYFEQLGVDVEMFGNAPAGPNAFVAAAAAVEETTEDVEELESDDEEGKQAYEEKRRRRVVQAALSRSLVVQSSGGGGVTPQPHNTNGEASAEDADTNVDREELRKEFIRIMKERFLDGRDQEFFDYTHVDENSEFDDFVEVGRDAEERYFDEEGGMEKVGEDKSPVVRSTAEWENAWNQGSVNSGEYDY
ncbi:hypothetical protein HDU81_005426 [Chytriomyces hyalinus]|nr:hypothetical protein HDU81_005426 [Chytriomyces hyalinus]